MFYDDYTSKLDENIANIYVMFFGNDAILYKTQNYLRTENTMQDMPSKRVGRFLERLETILLSRII